MGAIALRGYYAILDVRQQAPGDLQDVALLAHAEELLAAGPCCLQLRAKQLGGASFLALARALGPLCHRAAVPFCVNDRLDVALAAGAQVVDMVHVGQEDLSLADVRRVLAAVNRQLLVGVSTHSLSQALAAEAGGADYIGFGPVFPTGTKDRPDPVVGLVGLRQVTAAVALPVVAIGGITRVAVGAVVAAGAAAAAVIGDIESASSRLAAAREVAGAFAASPPTSAMRRNGHP
jgi:thiamine-phosphate pyrophosphorylase